MAKIHFYLNVDKIDSLGFVPIRAKIKNNWKAIEKVKVSDWNPTLQRVIKPRRGHKDNRHAEINALLDQYQAKANELFNYCTLNNTPLTDKLIKDFYAGRDFKKNKANDFNAVFNEFLTVTKNTKSIATYINRRTVFHFFEHYQEHIKTKLTLSDIDASFFDGLQDYSYNVRKAATNTFSKNTAVLKTFLNWCVDHEYYSGNKYHKFKAPSKKKEIIYLTVSELQALMSFVFDNPKLDRARDVFIVGCTTGLRFSDLMDLRREHLKNGFIEKIIQKTQEPATIPILPHTQRIIDKYDHPVRVLPKLTSKLFNRYIKEACKLAGIDQMTVINNFSGNRVNSEIKPKYELITAHTARRTFVSISFAFGVQREIGMKITGHTQHATYDKYLKIDDELKSTILNEAWGKL